MFMGFKKDHIPLGPLKTTLLAGESIVVFCPMVALAADAPGSNGVDDDTVDSLPFEDPPAFWVFFITLMMWFSILSLSTARN